MTPQMEFAERCAAVAEDLALLYAGEPDEKMTQSLAEIRNNLQTELAKVLAVDVDIPTVVDLFIDAILARKREIERDGSGIGRN